MNAPIRSRPSASIRCAMSTSTSARATAAWSAASPTASSDEMPPSDAPTSTGGIGSDDDTVSTSLENPSIV